MTGYHSLALGRNEICAKPCTIEKDRIVWDDGCIRTFYENGTEQTAKVYYDDKTKWNYTERDPQGKIVKEWNEPGK